MENLENAIVEIKEKMPGLKLLENEPMSSHCSFRIGGPVRALAAPKDVTGLSKLCHLLKTHHISPLLLGNGTNILFPDEGLKDLFIISTENLTKMFLLPDGAIYAEAGVSLAKLASFAQQNGLAGLEFASGIPGTVGGGVRMNAAILSAVFRLQPGDKAEISAKMRELNERRRDKQPLDMPSAGSAFKRPEGHYAAALIEEVGLKGYSVGGAQVSEKHSGFVVNTGGATSHDVYDLMMHVRNTVYKERGVFLEPEIIILPPEYALVDEGPDLKLNSVQVNDMSRPPEPPKEG